MIYSASRRTDLVAFYPDHIVGRVRRSRKLEAVVFWTKDPRNLSAHPGLRAVTGRYPSVVQLTMTGLAGTRWEPRVPPPEALADALRELAARFPPGAVVWRFDPVLADESLYERFDRVHAFLRGVLGEVAEVTVSFPDAYRKVVRRLAAAGMALPVLSEAEQRDIAANLVERSGLRVRACCEPHLLDVPGVRKARCVDGARFDRLYGTSFGVMEKDRGQREACGCVRSTDIGSYEQVCGHACRYCYARPEA